MRKDLNGGETKDLAGAIHFRVSEGHEKGPGDKPAGWQGAFEVKRQNAVGIKLQLTNSSGASCAGSKMLRAK